jgi:hypothetical protein
VRIKPYRLPPLMDAELNRQLSKLCQSGVFWNRLVHRIRHPVFLVRKPRPPGAPPQTETGSGNTWRIVTDLRQLNLRVAPLYHALPRVEDSMHKLGQARANLYSIFDQKGAFYALSLAEESRDITAISSSKYHLRYTRLPLGLKIEQFNFPALPLKFAPFPAGHGLNGSIPRRPLSVHKRLGPTQGTNEADI